MKCEKAKDQFSLYLYGELPFDEEEGLERHLDACESCRRDFERVKALHAAINESELAPSAAHLAACRRELRSAVAAQAAARAGRGGILGWLPRISILIPGPVNLWRPVGAVALVALGFIIARVGGPVLEGEWAAAGVPAPSTARVRYVEPGDSGRIQVVVDETRQRVLKGRLDDERFRVLLLAAAKDPSDPGLRADTVDVLKTRCDSSEIRRALLQSLRSDPNGAVRLKALEGLKQYARDPEVRGTLARVLLEDQEASVRTQAIDLLVASRNSEVVGVLQELLEKEKDNYIRQRSQKVLHEMKASTGTF